MIDKQIQDQTWSMLPKEGREVAKYYYRRCACGPYTEGAIIELFGEHNLTSDAEPEKVLYVKAGTVKDIYNSLNNAHPKEHAWVVKQVLESLFGTKCLPDEPPLKITAAEDCIAMAKEELSITDDRKSELPQNPAEICDSENLISKTEPRFKSGDKVRTMNVIPKSDIGRVGVVESYNEETGLYNIDYGDNTGVAAFESDLEPYAESTPKDNNDNQRNCDNPLANNEGCEWKQSDGKCSFDSACYFEPLNAENFKTDELTQNNDNMEEKELNLCEILKGHEKEYIFSPIYGNVQIGTVSETAIHTYVDDEDESYTILFLRNGKYQENGLVMLYPSLKSYLKYPLDAKRAWREWQDEKKPKRWKPNQGDAYFYIDNDGEIEYEGSADKWVMEDRYKFCNCFRTEELAQQAAKVVYETLEQFLKDHQQ